MFIQFTQGLFSRITFREPVFLGGTGNITGLAKRLPVADGMTGCIRKFVANEHEYVFTAEPTGDITHGFDIRKYCVIVYFIDICRCTCNTALTLYQFRECIQTHQNSFLPNRTIHVNAIEEINMQQFKNLPSPPIGTPFFQNLKDSNRFRIESMTFQWFHSENLMSQYISIQYIYAAYIFIRSPITPLKNLEDRPFCRQFCEIWKIIWNCYGFLSSWGPFLIPHFWNRFRKYSKFISQLDNRRESLWFDGRIVTKIHLLRMFYCLFAIVKCSFAAQ